MYVCVQVCNNPHHCALHFAWLTNRVLTQARARAHLIFYRPLRAIEVEKLFESTDIDKDSILFI